MYDVTIPAWVLIACVLVTVLSLLSFAYALGRMAATPTPGPNDAFNNGYAAGRGDARLIKLKARGAPGADDIPAKAQS